MNGPIEFVPKVPTRIVFALPRWVFLAFGAAVMLNAFATALVATALIVHLTTRVS